MAGPEAVVDRQVEAYNAHDLDAFLDCYADDAVIRDGDGRVLMAGRQQLAERYGELFASHPDMRAEIGSRVVLADWVVDEEHVRSVTRQLHAVVAYRVSDSVIRAVVMLGGGS